MILESVVFGLAYLWDGKRTGLDTCKRFWLHTSPVPSFYYMNKHMFYYIQVSKCALVMPGLSCSVFLRGNQFSTSTPTFNYQFCMP